MKFSQLLFIVLFAIVGSAIAQDDAPQQVNCDAVCASQVDEVVGQANREKDELHNNVRAANERLEQANEIVHAREMEINGLREEIGSVREQLGALEGRVADGERALATAKGESAKALGAESQKGAATAAKLAIAQLELAAAQAETAEFASSRFLINVKLIEQDIKDFFKKMGLIKSKDSSDDL
jgi:chromosome segregation ATPase